MFHVFVQVNSFHLVISTCKKSCKMVFLWNSVWLFTRRGDGLGCLVLFIKIFQAVVSYFRFFILKFILKYLMSSWSNTLSIRTFFHLSTYVLFFHQETSKNKIKLISDILIRNFGSPWIDACFQSKNILKNECSKLIS